MIGFQMMNDLNSLHKEMEQLFNGLGFHPVADVQRDAPFSVTDTGAAFEVEAVLPGLDIEKLDINILGRRLTVAGEFAHPELPEGATWHRNERRSGRFERNLQLAANVETDQVEAEYEQGILHIKLPKAASALPKKISVKSS